MSDDIVKQLLDRKGKLGADIRAHAAEAEKNGWTAEDNEKWDRLITDYDAVSQRADELHRTSQDAAKADEQRAEHERIVRSTPTPTPGGPKTPEQMTDDERLRAFLSGEYRGDGRDQKSGKSYIELRLSTAEQRLHSKVTAASGGTTVPRDFVSQLYDYLVAGSPIRSLATVRTTNTGQNLDFPVVASHGTAAIVGEGTALAGTDASFTTVTLGSWKYGKLTQLTNELVTDSGVDDLIGWITMDAGRSIAMAQGAHFATGTGSNQPLGYGTAYPIGVTGATGGTGVPSINNLIDLFYSVDAPYRLSTSCAWIARDASWAYVRKLAVASTAPEGTWATNLQAGQPDLLLGKPVYADPNAAAYGTPAKPISFGDWSTYVIRDVGTVRMERSDDFAFDKDEVTYRTILRSDANIIDTRGVRHFAGPST